MAKGQMRSNKEVRKPKADKKAAKSETASSATPGKFSRSLEEKKK